MEKEPLFPSGSFSYIILDLSSIQGNGVCRFLELNYAFSSGFAAGSSPAISPRRAIMV
jgi:hypothetical protein